MAGPHVVLQMRCEDWPERLAAFVASRRHTPFAFGSHDCALFAADWILECTGTDPIAEIRGQWTDERSAMRILQDNGGIEALANRYLGEPVAPLLARRGDIVLVELTGRPGLGVCLGETLGAPSDDVGVTVVSIAHAIKGWSV